MATRRRVRLLGAVVAAAVASIPALTDRVELGSGSPLNSSLAVSIIGGAVVVPLGWRIAPAALGSFRQARRAIAIMATMPVVIGAFAWATARMVKAVAEGNASPLEIVPGGLVLGALGVVVFGWLYVLVLTLPSALVWAATLRVMNWLTPFVGGPR